LSAGDEFLAVLAGRTIQLHRLPHALVHRLRAPYASVEAGEVVALAWSPAAPHRLAVATAAGECTIFSVNGRAQGRLSPAAASCVRSLAWDPTGRALFVGYSGGPGGGGRVACVGLTESSGFSEFASGASELEVICAAPPVSAAGFDCVLLHAVDASSILAAWRATSPAAGPANTVAVASLDKVNGSWSSTELGCPFPVLGFEENIHASTQSLSAACLEAWGLVLLTSDSDARGAVLYRDSVAAAAGNKVWLVVDPTDEHNVPGVASSLAPNDYKQTTCLGKAVCTADLGTGNIHETAFSHAAAHDDFVPPGPIIFVLTSHGIVDAWHACPASDGALPPCPLSPLEPLEPARYPLAEVTASVSSAPAAVTATAVAKPIGFDALRIGAAAAGEFTGGAATPFGAFGSGAPLLLGGSFGFGQPAAVPAPVMAEAKSSQCVLFGAPAVATPALGGGLVGEAVLPSPRVAVREETASVAVAVPPPAPPAAAAVVLTVPVAPRPAARSFVPALQLHTDLAVSLALALDKTEGGAKQYAEKLRAAITRCDAAVDELGAEGHKWSDERRADDARIASAIAAFGAGGAHDVAALKARMANIAAGVRQDGEPGVEATRLATALASGLVARVNEAVERTTRRAGGGAGVPPAPIDAWTEATLSRSRVGLAHMSARLAEASAKITALEGRAQAAEAAGSVSEQLASLASQSRALETRVSAQMDALSGLRATVRAALDARADGFAPDESFGRRGTSMSEARSVASLPAGRSPSYPRSRMPESGRVGASPSLAPRPSPAPVGVGTGRFTSPVLALRPGGAGVGAATAPRVPRQGVSEVRRAPRMDALQGSLSLLRPAGSGPTGTVPSWSLTRVPIAKAQADARAQVLMTALWGEDARVRFTTFNAPKPVVVEERAPQGAAILSPLQAPAPAPAPARIVIPVRAASFGITPALDAPASTFGGFGAATPAFGAGPLPSTDALSRLASGGALTNGLGRPPTAGTLAIPVPELGTAAPAAAPAAVWRTGDKDGKPFSFGAALDAERAATSGDAPAKPAAAPVVAPVAVARTLGFSDWSAGTPLPTRPRPVPISTTPPASGEGRAVVTPKAVPAAAPLKAAEPVRPFSLIGFGMGATPSGSAFGSFGDITAAIPAAVAAPAAAPAPAPSTSSAFPVSNPAERAHLEAIQAFMARAKPSEPAAVTAILKSWVNKKGATGVWEFLQGKYGKEVDTSSFTATLDMSLVPSEEAVAALSKAPVPTSLSIAKLARTSTGAAGPSAFGAPAPAPAPFGSAFGTAAPAPAPFGGAFGTAAPAPAPFGGAFGTAAPAPAPFGGATPVFGLAAPALGSAAPTPASFGGEAPAFGAKFGPTLAFGSTFGAPAPAPASAPVLAFGGVHPNGLERVGAQPLSFGAPAGAPAAGFGTAPTAGSGGAFGVFGGGGSFGAAPAGGSQGFGVAPLFGGPSLGSFGSSGAAGFLNGVGMLRK